ncbi:unnamed protein product [Mesocestoides corti]|nr:unnamed protein product [Mesocestoides corti]
MSPNLSAPPLPRKAGSNSQYPGSKNHEDDKIPPDLPPKNFNYHLSPSGPPKKPQEEVTDTQRANVVAELIENEKRFKTHMTCINNVLTKGLVPVPIAPEDLQAVLLNISDYINVSAEMIKAYERAVDEAPNRNLALACVGKHLLPTIPAFHKEIVAYIKDYDPKIIQHRPHLAEFFDKAAAVLQKEDGSAAVLTDRLLTPFQRPFNVLNILGRLKKYTPETHPDCVSVKCAINGVRAACDDAERAKKEDNEYSIREDVIVQPDNTNTQKSTDFTIENTRLTYYRKKGAALSTLIDDLSKWIESRREALKLFVENRRSLIKKVQLTLKTLDSLEGVYIDEDLNAGKAGLIRSKYSPEKFDKACSDVLDRLKTLNQALKRLKAQLKKLKNNAMDIAKQCKGKAPISGIQSTLTEYRSKERLAITRTEFMLNRSEKVLNTLLFYYLFQVQVFLAYAAINPTNLVQRYVKDVPRLSSSEVNAQIAADVREYLSRIQRRDSGGGDVYDRPRNTYERPEAQHQPSVDHVDRISLAEVLHAYTDQQTTTRLLPGTILVVIQWADGRGNRDWAFVRTSAGEKFFYPSRYLKCLY